MHDIYDLEVFIARQPNRYSKSSPIKISEIQNIHWANTSGGYNKRTGYYTLYGYIPYELATELVDCSGEHKFYRNDAKICIPKSLNTKEPYKSNYKRLEEMYADEKPLSTTQENRPEGYPPCTKQIVKLLIEKSPQTRKELRNTILEIGYQCSTFRNAMRSLLKTNRIKVEGSSYSPDQKIFITVQ